jgi:c-di-GMP-binding flagellar brake protein YcgR
MDTRDQLGDRRAYLRFNSAGQVWASLDRVEQVVVRNLSLTGVLVEVPAGLQSMRIAQIALQDRGPVIDAVARHASPASDQLREDRFLVGLEFVNLSDDERANLFRMVIDSNDAPR